MLDFSSGLLCLRMLRGSPFFLRTERPRNAPGVLRIDGGLRVFFYTMRNTYLLIGVALLGMVSVATAQETPAKDAPAKDAPAKALPVEEPTEVRLHTGNETEYKSLFETVAFEPEQERTVREKIEERRRALTTWVESEKGKELIRLRTELAAARRNKETDKIGPMRETIQPLADEYMQLRAQTRVGILETLSAKQMEAYVGQSLMQRLTSGLRRAELTDAQTKTIREMCNARATAWASTTTTRDDPYFKQLDTDVPAMRKTIYDSVLTPQQRATLESPRATTTPTTPTTPVE